jgi:hypothetical protein
MPQSAAQLPNEVRSPFDVFLNGVLQKPGEDYQVIDGWLIFEGSLRKDKISGWRWALGAWGVGTYRQDDSIDVRWNRPDGSPAVAEQLEIVSLDEKAPRDEGGEAR